MTGSFEDREKAFEAKWAHDEELRFRVINRRNRLIAAWAAGEMGLAKDATETYAKSAVELEVLSGKEEDIVRKIHADFEARKIARTEHLIRRKMEEFLATAKAEVIGETKA